MSISAVGSGAVSSAAINRPQAAPQAPVDADGDHDGDTAAKGAAEAGKGAAVDVMA